MLKRIINIFEYRDMISSLVRRELRGKYKGSVLGFLWTYLNPLCQVVIYSAVFSIVFRVQIEKFYLYLIIGMMPWTFFSTTVQGGANCIRAQSEMVKKIYFPREVLPISFATSSFVNMLLSFIITFLAIATANWGFNLSAILYLPLVMIIEYFFSLGLLLIVSAVTVYFRDLEHIMSVLMMAWIYVTPIMYDVSYIPEEFRDIFFANPMTPIICAYHDILYYKQLPDVNYLIQSGIVAFVVLVIGFLAFAKLDRSFAEEM